MQVTRQLIVDTYNSVYHTINDSVLKTYEELNPTDIMHSLLILVAQESAASSGGISVSDLQDVVDQITDYLETKDLATSTVINSLTDIAVNNLPAVQSISATSLPLPVGAATAALQQASNTSLSAIDIKLPSLVNGKLPIDISSTVSVSGTFWQATQPISAVSLPLPSGAATSALQNTANISLASIDSKLSSPIAVRLTTTVVDGLVVRTIMSANNTNTISIKASAGLVYGWDLYNNNALATKYFKFYNKASAPVLVSDTPVITLAIPPGQRASFHSSIGISFAAGIAMAITGGILGTDVTAVLANDVTGAVFYQ